MKKRTMRLGCILLSTALLGTAALTGCRQMKKNTTDTKKTESSSTKESAKEKKVRRLTDSPMNPQWIWNTPKVFRYITTKTAIR